MCPVCMLGVVAWTTLRAHMAHTLQAPLPTCCMQVFPTVTQLEYDRQYHHLRSICLSPQVLTERGDLGDKIPEVLQAKPEKCAVLARL